MFATTEFSKAIHPLAASSLPVAVDGIRLGSQQKRPKQASRVVCISVGECLEIAGGCTVEAPTVLTGGLMMGGVTEDLSEPVTKTTNGLIALPSDHYLVRRKTASQAAYTRIGHGQCDQCSLCTELCPRYILGYPIQPHMVMRTLLMTGSAKERGSLWAQYCCECNVCSLIACPEQLDPMRICVDAKAVLKEQQVGRTEEELRELFRDIHPARKGREIPIDMLYRRLGLAPYDRKAPYRLRELRTPRVRIPLDSHIGQPAQPTVRIGEHVQRGQVIARVASDQLGCPVHASIAGRVTAMAGRAIEISA